MSTREFVPKKDTSNLPADRPKGTHLLSHAFVVLSLLSVSCFLLFSDGLRASIETLWELVRRGAQFLGSSL